VTLTAVLSYDNGAAGGLRYERDYEVIVYGPELSEEEKLSNQIKEAIRSADEQSASEERLPLPGRMGSRSIVWEEKPSGSGISVLVFAGIVSFLAAAAMGSRLHNEVVQRERQMMLDYPQIISKFVLFLGAGLSVRSTFIKIGEDYSKRREQGMPERGAYEEILLVCRELASGVPETEAYANFGQRCRSRQYTRLSALLAQNLKKGNQELLSVMRQEAKASYEERQNTARKLGEEAETKLLLPMILMLAITMLIIIIPAYYSFAA
jgi:pilus assembly protein TadC